MTDCSDIAAEFARPLMPLDEDALRTQERVIKRYRGLPVMSWWRVPELIILRRLNFEWPILDLGCGDGTMAEVLFGKDHKVTLGLDLSDKDTRRAEHRDVYETVMRTDLRAPFPAKDESFQTVFSNSVFEHIPGVEVLFPQIHRVLKPGGTLIFTVPSEHLNSMLRWPKRIHKVFGERAAKRWQRWWDRRVAHVNLGGEPYWTDLLTQAGLEIVTVQPLLCPGVIHTYERWQMLHNIGIGRFNLGTVIRMIVEGTSRMGWSGPTRALSAHVKRHTDRLMEQEPARPGGNLLFVARRFTRE